MQKKLIVLALASALSPIAFAQSNVTLYGVADMSYVFADDNYNSNTKNLNAIQSGGLNGSRFGFSGSEDLGNGLKAKFRMEGGVNMDTGASANTGVMGRWSTVSLASDSWGEIQAGRRETFHYELLKTSSGNGLGSVAQTSPVYLYQTRMSNAAVYLSPDWNGFQLKAGFSTNGTDGDGSDASKGGNDVVPNPITAGTNTAANSNLRVYTLALNYQPGGKKGPLFLGASYDSNRLQDRTSIPGSLSGSSGDGSYNAGSVWNIAGAYDFGRVRVDGAFGMINYAQNDQFKEVRDQRQQWTVGLVVPITERDRVMFDYAHAKLSYNVNNTKDDSMSLWGVNYMHDFSKRTVLYAAYGKINQDDNFSYAKNMASLSGTGSGYQQALQLGLRHNF